MPAYEVFGIFDDNIKKFISTVITLDNFPIYEQELTEWFYDQGANSYLSHYFKAWYAETKKHLENHATVPRFLRSSILGYTFTAFTSMEKDFFNFFQERFPKTTVMPEFVLTSSFFASLIIVPIANYKDFYKLEAQVMNTLQAYRDSTTATDPTEYRKQMTIWIHNKFNELSKQKKYSELVTQIEAHLKFTQAFVENTTPSLSTRSLASDSAYVNSQDSPSLFARRLTTSPPLNTSSNIIVGTSLGQSSRALITENAHAGEGSPVVMGLTSLALGPRDGQRSNSTSTNSSNSSTASTSPPSQNPHDQRLSKTAHSFFLRQQQAARADSGARLIVDPDSSNGRKITPPRTPNSTTNNLGTMSPGSKKTRPGAGG